MASSPTPPYSRTYMCIHVYICVYMCIYVYICVYMCIHVYICVYMCIYVYTCVYMCIYAYSGPILFFPYVLCSCVGYALLMLAVPVSVFIVVFALTFLSQHPTLAYVTGWNAVYHAHTTGCGESGLGSPFRVPLFVDGAPRGNLRLMTTP